MINYKKMTCKECNSCKDVAIIAKYTAVIADLYPKKLEVDEDGNVIDFELNNINEKIQQNKFDKEFVEFVCNKCGFSWK